MCWEMEQEAKVAYLRAEVTEASILAVARLYFLAMSPVALTSIHKVPDSAASWISVDFLSH